LTSVGLTRALARAGRHGKQKFCLPLPLAHLSVSASALVARCWLFFFHHARSMAATILRFLHDTVI